VKRTVFWGLLSMLFVSCGTVRVNSWMDPSFGKGWKIGKTAVLAIAESDSLRREYEDAFVEGLTLQKATAESLVVLLPKTEKMTKEELVALLKKNGFDSIFITRKVSSTERQQVVDMGYPAYYGDYYNYYSYAFGLSFGGNTQVYNYTEFEMETNLYDVKSQKLVWSARQRVTDDRSSRSNIKGMVNGLLKDLRQKGLL